jgi:hypothetical protein
MTDKNEPMKDKKNMVVDRARKMAQEKSKNINNEELEARVNERFLNGAFGPNPEITSKEQDEIIAMLDGWPENST